MRTRGRVYFILFLAPVLAAAALTGCVGRRGARRGAAPAVALVDAPRPERSLPPLPQRPLGPRLTSLRTRAMEQAERVRGLAWLEPVGMTELTGWEYGTRTKALSDALVTDDLKALSRLAAAGGMLPEGTDLASLAASFTAATAAATYSPLDKHVLIVSGGGAKPDDAGTTALLTHEFVHALQDQHYDLLKMMLARPFDFDRTEALFALVEGDAMSVERRAQYGEAFTRLTPEEITRREDALYAPYRKGIGALFPPLLTETFIFRYRDGLHFVETLRRARPSVGADQIFRRPPRTSEQVLHPEKYLSDEGPRDVRFDTAALESKGWRLSATTPLGEVGVRGLLMSGVGEDEARRAAAGWGGDRMFLFEKERRPPLFVWKIVWDTQADAQEFYRSYNALQRRSGASDDSAGAGPHRAWREGGTTTFVAIEGVSVLIVRGTADDAGEVIRAAG